MKFGILTFVDAIERLASVNYKNKLIKFFSKIILRLSKFHASTNPLVPFLIIIGGLIGCMTSIFDFPGHSVPTKITVLIGTIAYSWMGVVGAYFLWEMYRGWLFLERWAKSQNK